MRNVNARAETHTFDLSESQVAALGPSAGGRRKRKPPKPWEDPPELLVAIVEMTHEMWTTWEWPADTDRLPSNRRKTSLILWRRDGNICQVCGLTVDIHLRNMHPGMASIDHIEPVRRYAPGADASRLNLWGNVRLAHLHCNTAHGAFDPRLIAVEDYRRMLRTAIAQFETGTGVRPPGTWITQLKSPHITPAWEKEQVTGRPNGLFGQEWTVPEQASISKPFQGKPAQAHRPPDPRGLSG